MATGHPATRQARVTLGAITAGPIPPPARNPGRWRAFALLAVAYFMTVIDSIS